MFPADAAEFDEQIGPHQVEGDRLWFGKSFYNGEGATGVGGFGYFDAETRSYKLYSPREIWPWSVSALLVAPDAVWLALMHEGEGWSNSGGLLRWDRAIEQLRHYDLKTIAHQIVRHEETLYLASDDGIETLNGDELNRYIVDLRGNGEYQVVRCEGGIQ